MTKLNWVFVASLLCALIGCILLEEVGKTYYTGFLTACGIIISLFTGGFSLNEYLNNKNGK